MKLFETAPNKRVAAIAQSVERILGKDEVASSNLASSSKELRGFDFGVLSLLQRKTGDLILRPKGDSIVRSQGYRWSKAPPVAGSQFKSG